MSTQKIQDVVNKFVADVTELAKNAARDALSKALQLPTRRWTSENLSLSKEAPSVFDLVDEAYAEIDKEKGKKRKKWKVVRMTPAVEHAKGLAPKRKTKKQRAQRDANRAWRLRKLKKMSAADRVWLTQYTKKHSP